MQENQEIIGVAHAPTLFDTLSEREKLYVEYYVGSGSQYRAALQAGYGDRDKIKAAVAARHLMEKPQIRLAIQDLQQLQRTQYAILRDKLIESIIEDAFFDPGECYDVQGNLIPVSAMPPHVRQRIVSYKCHKGSESIEFVDRQRAKAQLLDILGIGQQSQGLQITINLAPGDTPAERPAAETPGVTIDLH
jgi:phage terminase small subunit